jgi:hypothetical protein
MYRHYSEMKNAVFWDVAAPAHAGSSLADFSTLKMEEIRSSETSVYAISTRRHISKDVILHSHCRENLKSYIIQKSFSFVFMRGSECM